MPWLTEVIPRLYDNDEASGPLRIWVPGCASGEEAYSLAMLFADEAARRDARVEVQIFASDLDTTALDIAREGRYPLAVEADIGEERLRKYFTKEADHYRIRREIRDMVLFATHSLLRDPPLSKLHLISCRNLLIYLEKELQQQVISTFNYALKPSGYLFLGSSETAEHPAGFFRVVDRDARIYQSVIRPAGEKDFPHVFIPPRVGGMPVFSSPVRGGEHAPAATHQRALELSAPPSVLVDVTHQIVNMSEEAGRFIQPSGGQSETMSPSL